MTTLWRLAATLLFLVLPFSCQPRVAPVPPYAAHHIRLDTKYEWFKCSATAVNRHTLLTAAHCIIGTDKIKVDDQQHTITFTMYDANDHVLIGIDGEGFASYMTIEQRSPAANEHVRIVGWPGTADHAVARDGTFLRHDATLYDGIDIWTLPCYPGDSGSGVISDSGTVITVVSTANVSAASGTFPLAFSPDQLKAMN